MVEGMGIVRGSWDGDREGEVERMEIGRGRKW